MKDVVVSDTEWQDAAGLWEYEYEEWREVAAESWEDVDRELRSIARRQSGLDAALMIALREAERVRLWSHVGCSSMMEYLERVFGYAPRVAQERLRTARKLEKLPELGQALANNEIPFSTVREVSRIATPSTEAVWRSAVLGKSLREVEEMVSGLREGDLPNDKKHPELQTKTLSFYEVTPATRALARQVRDAIDGQRGERLDDDAFLSAVFQLALAATQSTDAGPSRPKFQIVQYHCENCKQAKQLGAGVQFDIPPADAERATCDAEYVSGDHPDRITTAVPPKVRRLVELRDGKRCCIPGCRSTRNLELHHIIHRQHGGTHDPSNLVLLCEGHHAAHHRGTLIISGKAPDALQFDRIVERVHMLEGTLRPAHVGAPVTKFDFAEKRTLAVGALVKLGWKPPKAGAAVDAALEHLGADASMQDLVRDALPRCLE